MVRSPFFSDPKHSIGAPKVAFIFRINVPNSRMVTVSLECSLKMKLVTSICSNWSVD